MFWLQRMDLGKSRQCCHVFINFRIVLHRTRSKWIETIIDSMGFLCQFCIVSGKVILRHLRKVKLFLSCILLTRFFDFYIAGWEHAHASSGSAFSNTNMLYTSFKMRITSSISSFVFISVQHHNTRWFPSGYPPRIPCSSSAFNASQGHFSDTVTNSWKNSPYSLL